MAQPLRMVFVAGSLGGGGAERRLVDVLNHLDPERISPRLYLAYRRGELLAEVPDLIPIDAFSDGERPPTLAQRWLARLRCPSLARAWHLRDILQRSRADAVCSWSLLPSYETALACRRLSIPQIASVGVHPLAEIEDAFDRTSGSALRRAQWTYRRSSLILANSTPLRDQFQAIFQLPAARVQSWLQTRDFERIDRLAAAEDPVWPNLGRRIVAAGRLRPQKGFDLLLEALSRLQTSAAPLQLALLGQGPAESDLRQRAVDLGIADRVRFLGFQPNPYPWFRTADVFALPSRFEGNPNTLIEAMACRVPVIAADCPTGPREILQDGRLGRLVPMNDAEALTAALRQVLTNPPSTQSLDEARRSVLDRYGLSNCTNQLEALVRSLTDLADP